MLSRKKISNAVCYTDRLLDLYLNIKVVGVSDVMAWPLLALLNKVSDFVRMRKLKVRVG